jgi:hypothetical protein
MKRKTPQEKKSESYAKDRRSIYGNNAKAARKAVPKRKQVRSQNERRLGKQELAGTAAADDEDRVDSMIDRVSVKRHKAWKKWPDAPLGEVLLKKGKRPRKPSK